MYIELIILENLLYDYLIIITTSFLLKRKIKIIRLIISLVLGSLSLLFLNYNKITKIIIYIISMLLISIISFNYHSFFYTLKNIIYLTLSNIFISGLVNIINIYLFPKNINNNINIILLIILSPLVSFIYLKSIIKIKFEYYNYYLIDIYLKYNKKITVKAFLDTGNVLKDPYSFKPIILVDKKYITTNISKIIYVPYKTISSNGLLECFKPQKIVINNKEIKNVLVGLIDKINYDNADAIIGQNVVERI